MIEITDALLALTLLSVLLSLGSNRLMSLVKIMAFQGITVSWIPFSFLLFNHQEHVTTGSVFFLQLMIFIKGLLIPGFMFMAVKKVKIQREVEPIIGYHASIFAGLFFILLSSVPIRCFPSD